MERSEVYRIIKNRVLEDIRSLKVDIPTLERGGYDAHTFDVCQKCHRIWDDDFGRHACFEEVKE